MSIRFEIKTPEVIKAIQTIAKASGLPIKEVAEIMLIASCARKSAWGDALNIPEPGLEFNKNVNGKQMKGDELYKEVYEQVRRWLANIGLNIYLLMESDRAKKGVVDNPQRMN